MATYIKTLKNLNDDILLPRTTSEAVLMEDGITTLQTDMDNKLNITSYTANDVLTKIKTVDGTGSGLDADLLDGQQGSYYAPLASPTFTDTVTVSNLLRLTNETDITLTSTTHAFQIGPSTGNNMAIDGNEIMARSNGVASPLYLNNEGSIVQVGSNILYDTKQVRNIIVSTADAILANMANGDIWIKV